MSNLRAAAVGGFALIASVVLTAARFSPPPGGGVPAIAVVGVLESPECQESGASSIRAVFSKTGSDWTPLNGMASVDRVITSDVSWTVALDGERLGTVMTIDPKQDTKFGWTDTRDRLLRLSPGQQLPRQSDPTHRFGGWCASATDRPLVVVNEPNYRDPDAWKPFDPPLSVRDTLMPAFRAEVGDLVTCPTNPAKDIEFDYTVRDLIIGSSYRDRTGATVVSLELDPKKNSCAAPSGDAWSTHWYLLGDQPRSLGEGFQLVNAGDYDGDGRSELLFWYSGHSGQGYTMFSGDFEKRVDVRWVSQH